MYMQINTKKQKFRTSADSYVNMATLINYIDSKYKREESRYVSWKSIAKKSNCRQEKCLYSRPDAASVVWG